MIAHRVTGGRTWHWAHETANPNCRTSGETEWHLAWKALGLEGTQERNVGTRWADVLAPGGYAVEFQRQPFDPPSEQRRREDDWADQGGMVWIFYAIEAAAEGRIANRVPWQWFSARGNQVVSIS